MLYITYYLENRKIMEKVWSCCMATDLALTESAISMPASLRHSILKTSKIISSIKEDKIIKTKYKELDKIVFEDCEIVCIALQNQVIYRGSIKNHRPNDDNALIIFTDGSYYQGKIVNGTIEGQGFYRFSDSSYSYKGQWKKGLPNGFGIQISPSGQYQGTFRNGKKWGKGQLNYPDGSTFNGSFINNEISGDGVLYSNKYMAKGNWINGFLEGAGMQRYNDNSQYVGPFKKGKPHGLGTFILVDGKVYVGNFQNGKAVGVGQFYYKNKQYSKQLKQNDMLSITVSGAQGTRTLTNSQVQFNRIYNQFIPNLSNRRDQFAIRTSGKLLI